MFIPSRFLACKVHFFYYSKLPSTVAGAAVCNETRVHLSPLSHPPRVAPRVFGFLKYYVNRCWVAVAVEYSTVHKSFGVFQRSTAGDSVRKGW